MSEMIKTTETIKWTNELVAALWACGYAIVPVEPTEAMEEAARDVPFIALGNGEYIEPERVEIYRAMIEAGRAKA